MTRQKTSQILARIFNSPHKQVCGEVCELIEVAEGRSKYRWIKKYPDVEALYCLVYILGLHTILNMHKWSEERWMSIPTLRNDL